VIIRKHVVVLSMNPLRAIVTADRLYLVAPLGAAALLYLIQGHMEGVCVCVCACVCVLYVFADCILFAWPQI
jgi:hypothetical protein